MDELSNALRQAFLDVLKNNDMTIDQVSNYNIARAAGSKVFTMILYRNIKTEKGDKRAVKLILDKEISTLTAAINVIESMMDEKANQNFLHKTKPKKETVSLGW